MQRTLSAFLALAAAACATPVAIGQPAPPPPTASPPPPPLARATIIDRERREIGEALIWEGPAGLLIRVGLEPGALAPGWHGLHVHEKADCGNADFTSSGAHAGHAGDSQHGLLNQQGIEPGDLPNLWVPAGAPAGGEFLLPFMTVSGAEGRAPLLDADGSAFVIHANPDDHVSQPIGGAGARLACGIIEPAPG